MNMSTTRHGRTTRILGSAVVLLATAGLLAACSSDDRGSDDATPTASATSAERGEASGEVTVIDQTKLLLVTAQETLEARGLTVTVTDASGAGREIADPTAWVVVTQDPASGTVEAGTEVALTVRMTTDPVG